MERFILIIIVLAHFGCGSSSNENEIPDPIEKVKPATSVVITDVGNFGNGKDIEFSFSKPSNLNLVEEFRLFLVPIDLTSSFLFDSIASLSETNYIRISKFNPTENIGISESQLDINGALIVENQPYEAYVLALETVENGTGGALSSASNSLTLEKKNVVWTLIDNIPGGSGGMDVDKEGNIYMSDFGTRLGAGNAPGSRVFKITPEGVLSTFASGLNGASGSDFDVFGNLIQSNIAGGSVSKITPEGVVNTIATGFQSPVGVTVAANGDFFVCNCNANTISKVSNDGSTVTTFASSSLMNCPNGIDMDDQGNLYVANFSNSNLVKITADGQVSVLANMPGNNNGHLLINGDFIYVVSRGLHKIHRVSFDGKVSSFAGNGAHGIKNGSLDEAGFAYPNDLAFSPDGKKIYVNDVNATNNGNILTPVAIRVIELVE